MDIGIFLCNTYIQICKDLLHSFAWGVSFLCLVITVKARKEGT